jgi:hypothetical protein
MGNEKGGGRRMGQVMWTKHSGQKIPINDMVDEHLLNSIYMIDRGVTTRGKALKPGQKELHEALISEAMQRNILPEDYGWDS